MLQEANISAAGLRQFGTGTAEVLEQVRTTAKAMWSTLWSTAQHGFESTFQCC